MWFAGKHSSDGSFGQRVAGIQRQEPAEQGRPSIRIDRSEPSSVAAQFAVEGAGNSAAGASAVGGKSKEHRIALGQAPAQILVAALTDPAALIERLGLRGASAAQTRLVLDRAARLAKAVVENSSEGRGKLVRNLVQQVVIGSSEISVAVGTQPLLAEIGAHAETSDDATMLLSAPAAFRRRGMELKLVLPAAVESRKPRQLDVELVKAVARGWLWFEQLIAGHMGSLEAIADWEGVSRGYPGRLLRLAFLAPDIVEAILQGRQPADLSLSRLTRQLDLPFEWASQRERLRA